MKNEQHRCSESKKDPWSFPALEVVSPDLEKQDDERQEEENGYRPGPARKNDGSVLNMKIQGIVAK
jgi:hypothetical protein